VRLPPLIRLGRPLFLVGGFVMFGLGATIAARAGHAIEPLRYALGQLAVTAFQLMTHYANDYYDYDADVANTTPTRWSGGSRVLPAGELARHVALEAALAVASVGALATVALAACAGVVPAVTLAVIAVLAWEYSAPPWRLCGASLGELTTALVVAVLVPWLGFSLQTPDLVGLRMLALAVAPLALLQFAMLVAIELPDAAGDRATGKRTLVVRLGPPAAMRVYRAATLGAFAWLPVAVALGLPARVAVVAGLLAPIAIWRAARIADGRHDRAGMFAVFLVVATAVAEITGFCR
jgi:1,4-dihydroxy-2-naphthoate octaprenyltransferase